MISSGKCASWRLAFICIASALLVGCAGTRTVDHAEADALLQVGDYRAYAQRYLDDKGQPRYDKENLLDAMEAGKAFHDAGMWQESAEAFDIAGQLLSWKEDTVDTPEEVAQLIGTTLTSDAFGSYQGKIHQGGLIEFYQGLNMLMMGREADARVYFNRLSERQDNALTQLTAFSRSLDTKDDKEVAEHSDMAKRSLTEVDGEIAAGLADLPLEMNTKRIRNAAGDTLTALFRATSSAEQDKRSTVATNALRQAVQASGTPEGAKLIKGLEQQLKKSGGRLQNKAIVIYEDGRGPKISEFRVDLPLFLVTDKVLYSGIALPRFERGTPAHGDLVVRYGKKETPTAALTDINELAGLEFRAAYQATVTRAVVSTIIKTTAQYAINRQIDEQAGGLMGALLKVGVGAAQYATTKADTRAWANLPNTVRMAVVDIPADRRLQLASGVTPIQELELPEGDNVLVLVKAAGPAAAPAVYQRVLPSTDVQMARS